MSETNFPEYETHPYANKLPEMSPMEYSALLKAIEEDGQAVPIVIHKGMILDGRHRYKVCKALGIQPKVVEYEGKGQDDDLLRFVQNAALKRELTVAQKAITAATFLDDEKKLAKKRQGRRNDLLPIDQEEKDAGDALSRLAYIHRVNRTYIMQAYRIMNNTPDLIEPLFNDVINLSAAKKISILPYQQRAEIIEKAKEQKDYKYGTQMFKMNHGVDQVPATMRQKLLSVNDLIKKTTRNRTVNHNETPLSSSPALVIFRSLNKHNDKDFQEKLKLVAKILELKEEEIWYCSPRSNTEMKLVQKVSELIHKKFQGHDRIVNGEFIK